MTKGPDAFRTISEAADELGVPQHVLRFWETRFSFIRPMKRAGGRRFYRPQDIAVLRGVRTLLHDEGYTIKGVQRLHREQGVRRVLAAAQGPQPAEGTGAPPAEPPAPPAEAASRAARDLTDLERRRLTAALEDLTAIKADLDGLLKHH
ncbi:MAG: MerR family transcriptional regulator [Caulobacteraceae bacterium]|nr:MerR family transcriptional regulator [Caulobacteraceae bacterium]